MNNNKFICSICSSKGRSWNWFGEDIDILIHGWNVNQLNVMLRIVGNSPSVSQSLTLDSKDKVKHYIRIKAHNNIGLRFWCKSGV